MGNQQTYIVFISFCILLLFFLYHKLYYQNNCPPSLQRPHNLVKMILKGKIRRSTTVSLRHQEGKYLQKNKHVGLCFAISFSFHFLVCFVFVLSLFCLCFFVCFVFVLSLFYLFFVHYLSLFCLCSLCLHCIIVFIYSYILNQDKTYTTQCRAH